MQMVLRCRGHFRQFLANASQVSETRGHSWRDPLPYPSVIHRATRRPGAPSGFLKAPAFGLPCLDQSVAFGSEQRLRIFSPCLGQFVQWQLFRAVLPIMVQVFFLLFRSEPAIYQGNRW